MVFHKELVVHNTDSCLSLPSCSAFDNGHKKVSPEDQGHRGCG